MPVMTMSSVRDYLVANRRATLADIAVHFGSAPDAVRPVVERWQEKGRIEVVAPESSCGKSGPACGCCAGPAAVYVWRDAPAPH